MPTFRPGKGSAQIGLPIKITVIVFWGLALLGTLISVFMLRGLEDRLADQYEASSDRLAYHIGQLIHKQHSDALVATLRGNLDGICQRLKIPAAELHAGAVVLGCGKRHAGMTAVQRSLFVEHLKEREKPVPLTVSVYYPNLGESADAHRKQLLIIIGLSLFVFGMVLVRILRHLLTTPFEQMMGTAQTIVSDDSTLRFATDRNDEFGYLGGFINKVLDQLLHKQDELEQALLQMRSSEAELQKEKERAEVTLHSIGDGVITTNAAGQVEYLNPEAERLTGWGCAQARGRAVTEVMTLLDDESRALVENPTTRCLRDGEYINIADHLVLIRPDGDESFVAASAAPIWNQKAALAGVVMILHDVEQSRELVRQLSYQASHDALTDLFNRAEFEARLRQALGDARTHNHSHALCYIDLDQFKVVNDTCGHVAGDEMLRQLASLLRSRVRGSDTLARLGGDEFGLLLRSCDLEHARVVAEGLRASVEVFQFLWGEHVFDVGASIGIAEISPSTKDVGEILSAADVACYAAKELGRNRVHVFEADDAELAQRRGEMHWVPRIRKAMEEDRLCLYAQQIVSVRDPASGGKHFEVLVRMRDEDGDLVPPSAFIPAAERYNLMSQVDRWVIQHTLSALREAWYERKGWSCSINLSGQSFSDTKFLEFVLDEIAVSGIDPRRICFEITETTAIANLGKATQFIAALKAIGCRFALDDFGNGLSSFGYLKNLKVDHLKIDGSFVRDMDTDAIHLAMVEAINRIGHVMNIETVAEFVENDRIMAALRRIGVDYAQGYGIAQPCPLADLLQEDVPAADGSYG